MIRCVKCLNKYQPNVILQGQELIRQLDNGEWWCWSCRLGGLRTGGLPLPLRQLDLFEDM